MRFALISDIHGNLEALTAVLDDIVKYNVDKIHCLGDVIGYGCDPKKCLELVDKHCDIKLIGNHEYLLLGLISKDKCNPAARISYKWTVDQLSDFEFNLIEEYQMKAVFENCLLIHSSPFKPDQWHYVVNTQEAELAFEALEHKFCFMGHSHLPMIINENHGQKPRIKTGHDFIMDPDYRYLVNVGSVGQPRDNDPRAAYVIVDTEEWEVFFKRVEYDIKLAQEKMIKAEMPAMLIERLSVGR